MKILKKKWKNLILFIKNHSAGTTLLELIVTFALLMIFTTSTCVMMSNTMQTYYRMSQMETGERVIEMIMDKIAGELWGAQVDMVHTNEESGAEGKTLKIGSHDVDYYDKSGNHAKISLKDNYLLIHYYEVKSTQQAGLGTENIIYEAIDWNYDQKAYIGYHIKDLTFSQPKGAYKDNVIKVELTIVSNKDSSREYSATKYIECYNFKEEDFDKIGTG